MTKHRRSPAALLSLGPLRHRDFRHLYFSQLVSVIGSQMTMVTVPFQVYRLTQSTFQTGLISATELVCLTLCCMWGGVVADRYDRRKIIIISEKIMLGLVAILAVNSLLPNPSLILIYIVAGLLAAIGGFHRPAFEALAPMLLPKKELPNLSTLSSFTYVSGSLIGPTVAGFFVASAGPFYTYVIDFLSFAISLQLLSRIDAQKMLKSASEAAENTPWIQSVKEGALYLWSRKDLLGSYVIDWFAMVFCMPQVLFPAFANLYSKNEYLGTLYMSVGLGSLVATLLSGWTGKVIHLGRAITFAALGWGLSIFTVGMGSSFWVIPIGLFCAGLCDSYSGIFRITMWNQSIPSTYRGRIASFGMLSYMSGPLLGNSIIGFLGDFLGLHEALRAGSLLSMAAVATAVGLLPAFWRYKSQPLAEENNEAALSEG